MVGKRKSSSEEDKGVLPLSELANLKDEISKAYKSQIFFGNDTQLTPILIPTGIPSIDDVLHGGFSCGQLTLLTGEYSTGKSLLSLLAIKTAQERQLSAVIIDTEKSYTPGWAAQLGVNTEQLLVCRPQTGEEAFDLAQRFVRRHVGILVIDSIASLTPSVEMEEENNDGPFQRQFIGVHARLINRGIRVLTSLNPSNGTCIIAINQLREKVGVMYGNPETLPGGKGQMFGAVQIFKVRRGPWLEEGEGKEKRKIGYKLILTNMKSKQGVPFQEGSIDFHFNGSFDEMAGLVDLGIDLEVIVQKGAMYSIGDEKVRGKAALIELLKSRQDLQDLIKLADSEIEDIEEE